MKEGLVRTNDRRSRECGTGAPACRYAPADGDNPLGLCIDHLAESRRACGIPDPVLCPACNPISVFAHGRYVTVPGAMCFACNATNGGTVPSAEHRADARRDMHARMLVLWREGDRGPEWVALLARCPEDLRERVHAAIAKANAAIAQQSPPV